MKSNNNTTTTAQLWTSVPAAYLPDISGGGCAYGDSIIYCPFPLEISYVGCYGDFEKESYVPAAFVGSKY